MFLFFYFAFLFFCFCFSLLLGIVVFCLFVFWFFIYVFIYLFLAFFCSCGWWEGNAYGSTPHKLIIFALGRYGVSPQWIRLVENYYKGIFSKSFSESATSAWHRHQQGIFAGCTLSIILFLAGMNIILEYCLQVKVPKFTTNNTELPLLRASIDDLSLMSSTVSAAQTLLSRCTTALT